MKFFKKTDVEAELLHMMKTQSAIIQILLSNFPYAIKIGRREQELLKQGLDDMKKFAEKFI